MLRAAENTRWERTDVPGTHRDLRDNVFVPVCPAARVSPPMQCVAVSGDDLGSQFTSQAGCTVRYPLSNQDILFA